MKIVPLALVRRLVEAALDQPKPTRSLDQSLQAVLAHGDHPDKLT